MTLFEELQWRGLIKDCSDLELAKKSINVDKTMFYTGFDPTGQSLTVGHLVQLLRIRFMQEHGFKVICLIGGATGLIGDPRESGERQLLTLETSLNNAKKIKEQISKYLIADQTIYVNNYDWLSKVSLIELLRDYGKHFNINYMLSKDIVSRRLETGISFTEFSYMILQSIDFLKLYKEYNCKLQFGGSDQWGNITSGLELIRKIEGQNDAVGISSPLLTKSDGKKFGKSESGTIWLDKELTSPYELYQYFLNTPDSDVIKIMKVLTLLSYEEITKLEKELQEKPEERSAHKKLAYEIVKLVHGIDDANEVIDVSNALFNNSFDTLNKSGFEMLLSIFKADKLTENQLLVDALISLGLASSKREAREFIKSGAVYVNDNKIVDLEYILNSNDTYFEKYVVVRRGKKKFSVTSF